MKCILHIGTEKTGTTTIQHTFHANDAELRRQGVHYCRSLGRQNNRLIATCAMRLDRVDETHKDLDLLDEAKRLAFIDDIKRRFDDEVRGLDDGIGTFVISNEHLQSRLNFQDEVDFVRDFLDGYFDRVSVVVYLRPQIDAEISLYSTMARAGGGRKEPLRRKLTVENPYFNYAELLKRWESAFGRQNMVVRNYQKVGNVLDDFLDLVGVDARDQIRINQTNEKLSADQIYFLIHMNKHFPRFQGPEANRQRHDMLETVSQLPFSRELQVSRADAMAFQGRFEAVNEEVRKAYFPQDETLFDLDFSKYPEAAAGLAPTTDELFETFATLWKAHPAERRLREGAAAAQGAARADGADLRSRLDAAESALQRMRTSFSWRLVKWLYAVERRLRRRS